MLTRLLQPTDFAALAIYLQKLFPQQIPSTAQTVQEEEAQAAQERVTGLVVGLIDDAIVAKVRYSEARSSEDLPATFWLYFSALPAYHTAPVFDALYEGVVAALQPYQLQVLLGMVREDDALGVDFFQSHQFREKLRSFGANLDLTNFDPASHSVNESYLQALGITIRTYADLSDDPLRDRKIYDLQQATLSDIPNMGQFDAQTFETFVTDHLHGATMIPEAYMIASHGDQYIGLSELFTSDEPGVFDTKATCVTSAFRRLGVAQALKVRALTYAKAQGGVSATTGMAATNTPIISLNLRLGFVPEPMWITFEKSFV